MKPITPDDVFNLATTLELQRFIVYGKEGDES